MTKDLEDAPGRRKLFGRRSSHKLRPQRAQLMQTLLPHLQMSGVTDAAAEGRRLDMREWFPSNQEVWLEIGFGGGEHLAHQARENPQVGIIGCEHYQDGVAKLLSAVEADGLENVRVHPHDARDLLDVVPDGVFSRVFLLYPDPWPKKRHHKRRFMGRENLDLMARTMRSGAILRVASDVPDYIRYSLQNALAHPKFEWLAERADDWRKPWSDWPGTRYEDKALREGRTPTYLTFRRI